MKWEIRVPEILFMTKEIDILELNRLENGPTHKGEKPVNLRDKQFLPHFFCEWIGYMLHEVQWNWPLSTGFDFDQW